MATNKKPPAVADLNATDFMLLVMGVISFSGTVIWILGGVSVRNESSDKFTYLVAGLSAAITLLISLRFKANDFLQTIFTLVTWVSVFIGIIAIEHFNMSKEHTMGFGWKVALLTVALLPVFYFWFKHPEKMTKLKLIFWVPAIFIIFCVSIAWWQTSKTLIEVNHSTYVINELLGPAAGQIPYQDFIPQYVYLLAWVIEPAISALGAVNGVAFIVLILNLFAYLSIIIMIYLSRRAAPTISLPVILVAALSFCTPTAGWDRSSYIGPATTLLSGPAIRIFGGMLVGLLTVHIAQNLLLNKVQLPKLFLLGMLNSLIIWNNLDFGIASTVASTLLIILSGILAKKGFGISGFLPVITQLFGQLLAHALVLGYLASREAIPNWSLFGWFMRQFGSGFGSVLIEMPGPVNIIFPLIMGSATLGIFCVIKLGSSENPISDSRKLVQIRSSVTAAYFGMFCGFALPYYVNRSYHAGQMSILYIPLAVALIASCSLMMTSQKTFRISDLKNTFPALILAFMVATSLLIPNPSIELKRLEKNNAYGDFPAPPLAEAIGKVSQANTYATSLSKSITYYGEAANYIKILTGMESSNIYNIPLDMYQNDAAVRLNCKVLLEKGGDFLLMSESGGQTFAWQDGSLCDGLYLKENVPGVGVLGVRKK